MSLFDAKVYAAREACRAASVKALHDVFSTCENDDARAKLLVSGPAQMKLKSLLWFCVSKRCTQKKETGKEVTRHQISLDIIEYLLSNYGKDATGLNTTYCKERTFLTHCIIKYPCEPLTQLLIRHGADPSPRLTKKGSIYPLLAAAKMNNVGIARILLDAGADVNGYSNINAVVRHCAAKGGLDACGKHNLKELVPLNAINYGHPRDCEFVQLLASRGASLHDSYAIGVAVKAESFGASYECMRALSDLGADMVSINKLISPFHSLLLCYLANEIIPPKERLDLYVETHGVDINAPIPYDGITPLHIVCMICQTLVIMTEEMKTFVEYFLNRGADPEAASCHSRTPLDHVTDKLLRVQMAAIFDRCTYGGRSSKPAE